MALTMVTPGSYFSMQLSSMTPQKHICSAVQNNSQQGILSAHLIQLLWSSSGPSVLMFFIYGLLVFWILGSSFSRPLFHQLNHLSLHYDSPWKAGMLTSLPSLSPLFTDLLLFLLELFGFQHTILLKLSLPKLLLPSLSLNSLEISSPWADWSNRYLLITLHLRCLSYGICLYSLLRQFLFSIFYWLFSPLTTTKMLVFTPEARSSYFYSFHIESYLDNFIYINTLENYFQIYIYIMPISRLFFWGPGSRLQIKILLIISHASPVCNI